MRSLSCHATCTGRTSSRPASPRMVAHSAMRRSFSPSPSSPLWHRVLDDGNAPTVVLGQGQHRGHLGAHKGGHVNFVDRQVRDLASAATASSMPTLVRGTSTQPVKRLAAFHMDWP